MGERTALVTGAAGFLGLNLVEQLLAAGWRVIALHRPSSDVTDLKRFKVEPLVGSITDRDWLFRAVPNDLDAIIHAAADKSLDIRGDAQQTDTNVGGTRNMLEIALARGTRRFVQTSSVAAFGVRHGETISETSATNAATNRINYSRSKWLADEEVRRAAKAGLDTIILHPANILGRYDARNWATMILLVAKGKLPGISPGGGAFCDAREVAKAHIAAIDRGRSGGSYVLGGVHASYVEVAQIIQSIVGGKAPRRPLPAWLMTMMGQIMPLLARVTGGHALITPEVAAMVNLDFRTDSRKAASELGYQEIPLRAMIEDACSWLKAESKLP